MSGWMLSEAALPAGPTFGLFKIVFKDASGIDLEPASISIGQAGPAANPGVESLPFLDSTSSVNTWVFSEAQGVAPANTTQVVFLALNVDFAGGENPMWFDDIQGENVTTSTALITNGSFETGDLSGWISPGRTRERPRSVHRELARKMATFAALLTQGSGVGVLQQAFPANPGEEFNMSGYMLTENAIPAGDHRLACSRSFSRTQGVLTLNQPQSASVRPARLQIRALNHCRFLIRLAQSIRGSSVKHKVLPLQAPWRCLFLALNVDFAGGVNPIWFDNIQASMVGGEPTVVVGETLDVAPGTVAGGGLPELEESDNMDLRIFRDPLSINAVTQFVLTATSPTATPSTFDFTLEGNVVSRPNVVQRIELFNYSTGAFEVVDERNANRTPNPDLTVTVSPGGDLSRFVNQSTREIQARIRYRADIARAGFASNTDQAVWTIQ